MTAPFSGGCACGAIRYVCSRAPVATLNCHCLDCQRSSGAPFASGFIVRVSDITITGALVRAPLARLSVTQRRRRKPSSPRGVELRGGGNQRPRVLMLRGREECGRRSVLDDPAFQHDVDAVRDRPDDVEIMRHE